jgi:hypothetical protein
LQMAACIADDGSIHRPGRAGRSARRASCPALRPAGW